MSGTVASFCLMAIAARELSGVISVFEILFFRSVIGLLVISFIIVFLGKAQLVTTGRISHHAIRNVFHFGGQFGWVLGIGVLPLAEVFALEFTVPVWVTIIAAVFLNERLTRNKLLSVSLGLLGVVVIVQPGIEIFDSAAFIVLGAAICYAITHTITKSLTNTEAPVTILFYMCAFQLPIGLILSYSDWHYPAGIQWLWLTLIGLTALTGHYCLSRAMQLSDVGKVMTLDFFRLPVIALLGVILYAEGFDMTIILGGALILSGNLFNFYASSSLKEQTQK